jgi:hypothetical protein
MTVFHSFKSRFHAGDSVSSRGRGGDDPALGGGVGFGAGPERGDAPARDIEVAFFGGML